MLSHHDSLSDQDTMLQKKFKVVRYDCLVLDRVILMVRIEGSLVCQCHWYVDVTQLAVFT